MSGCNLGYIMKDHMELLMDIFSNDLAEYHMNKVTTKCLNTAVLTMFSFIGLNALEHTRHCDVQNVQTRYTKDEKSIKKKTPNDISLSLAIEFRKKILKLGPKDKHTLYYVMYTDAEDMKKTDGSTQSFPGHVFVIDKFFDFDIDKPVYNIYQSYINQYDLKGAIDHNNKQMTFDFQSLDKFTNSTIKLFKDGIWTEDTTNFWKALTFVDAKDFEGCDVKNKILFCFREIPIQTCTRTFKDLLVSKLNTIDSADARYDEVKVILEKIKNRYRTYN